MCPSTPQLPSLEQFEMVTPQYRFLEAELSSQDESHTKKPTKSLITPESTKGALKKAPVGLRPSLVTPKVTNESVDFNMCLLTPGFTPRKSNTKQTRSESVKSPFTTPPTKSPELFPPPLIQEKHRRSKSTISASNLSFPQASNNISFGSYLGGLQHENNDIFSLTQSDQNQNGPICTDPITPRNQIISDDMVSLWNSNAYSMYSSDDSEAEPDMFEENPFRIERKRVESEARQKTSSRAANTASKNKCTPASTPTFAAFSNHSEADLLFAHTTLSMPSFFDRPPQPFPDSPNSLPSYASFSPKSFSSFTSNLQSMHCSYDTHMELVNERTGDKKVIKLTNRQMKIKPKKLDFLCI